MYNLWRPFTANEVSFISQKNVVVVVVVAADAMKSTAVNGGRIIGHNPATIN